MKLESLDIADLHQLPELQPDGWPDIVPMFKYYLSSDCFHPIKVQEKDLLIGVGAGIVFKGTGWIAHVIVRFDHRRQGVGQKIVEELMTFLQREGCATISLIATELGFPLYTKAGFSEQTEYIFLTNKSKRLNTI